MALVKMTTSVATAYGAYNAGHTYDLSPQRAEEFVRHGWGHSVQESPVESATLPTRPSEPQQRQGRGRPITSR